LIGSCYAPFLSKQFQLTVPSRMRMQRAAVHNEQGPAAAAATAFATVDVLH
jgi:hypothetical protein